ERIESEPAVAEQRRVIADRARILAGEVELLDEERLDFACECGTWHEPVTKGRGARARSGWFEQAGFRVPRPRPVANRTAAAGRRTPGHRGDHGRDRRRRRG